MKQEVIPKSASTLASLNYTYLSYEQIKAELLQLESQHPGIAKAYDIGDSWEKTQSISNRDILALKVSDNVTSDENEPEILVIGLIHAREWISSEIALALAQKLTESYRTDPRISWLVDNCETWIVPVLNPDGLDYALGVDNMWRKNRHLNPDLTYGVDLNRNFNGSSNGDPLGEWGGVGSSNLTSSELYCGPSPFSEPETSAIRDLVLAHNFTMALDFQSFGNQVLWPWGYTTNHTADYDDLWRIGAELATESGYVSEQSVGLYPTTGDVIDWMYGFAGVYAFTIEVGYEFHPANATVVASSIAANVNLSLRGIEISGDREERGLTIFHAPPGTANYSETGFELTARVTADRGVDPNGVDLYYSTDGYNWTRTGMAKKGGNDTYAATLPTVPVWHAIDYYIKARDAGGFEKVSPDYAPYLRYSLLVSQPELLSEGVQFDIPSIIDGTLGWTFNASISNYSAPVGVILNLKAVSKDVVGMSYQVPSTGDGHYSLRFMPGIQTGSYSASVVASVGGYLVWQSGDYPLEFADLTPPTLYSVAAEYLPPDSMHLRYAAINYACSDFYGVFSVQVVYRVHGGEWQTMSEQATADPITGGVFRIPLDNRPGRIEYRIEASDARNTVYYPSETGTANLTYPASQNLVTVIAIYGALGALAVTAVAVTVYYLVIRARRR